MVEKAERATRLTGATNVALHVGDIASLPLESGSVDVVISNGAINLSSHKPCVFQEAFRVLRPAGRLQFADMVRDGVAETPDCGSWADCVSGTVEPSRYLGMLAAVGFHDAEMISLTGYRTALTTIGATFRAVKPAAST
jgi:arsenite methyltransferase